MITIVLNKQSMKDLISDTSIKEKEIVLKHLKSGTMEAVYFSYAKDVLTGGFIGEQIMYNDGKYRWFTDTIYYFEKYNVKLPDDFIEHVLNQSKS